jgi:acetyl esterase/lipase
MRRGVDRIRKPAEFLRARGVDVKTVVYPAVGHGRASVPSRLTDDLLEGGSRSDF